MNRRKKNKRDKEAIKLAKKITCFSDGLTYWENNSETKRATMKYGYKNYMDARENFKYELKAKEMLLKVCRKCLQDGFPLEEYGYWEKPYSDNNGWIMCFLHMKDFEDYHHLNKKDTQIREIDFWCPHGALKAIPQGIDNNSNNYDCETCFDAVYDD